jgi:hypothetical protein
MLRRRSRREIWQSQVAAFVVQFVTRLMPNPQITPRVLTEALAAGGDEAKRHSKR